MFCCYLTRRPRSPYRVAAIDWLLKQVQIKLFLEAGTL